MSDGWSPVEHRTPYPRIDLYGPKPERARDEPTYGVLGQAIMESMREAEETKRRLESELIWHALVEVSQGNG